MGLEDLTTFDRTEKSKDGIVSTVGDPAIGTTSIETDNSLFLGNQSINDSPTTQQIEFDANVVDGQIIVFHAIDIDKDTGISVTLEADSDSVISAEAIESNTGGFFFGGESYGQTAFTADSGFNRYRSTVEFKDGGGASITFEELTDSGFQPVFNTSTNNPPTNGGAFGLGSASVVQFDNIEWYY